MKLVLLLNAKQILSCYHLLQPTEKLLMTLDLYNIVLILLGKFSLDMSFYLFEPCLN